MHLVRRNRVFHFRRRWPKEIRRHGAPTFLSVSLRTQVLSDAVKRSADLLSAIEAGERQVLAELQESPISEARVRAMLREIVRRAVAGMIARQESNAPAEQSDAYLGRLDAETSLIRDAQQTRDWSVASAFAREIARKNGLESASVESPAVARQVLSLLRRLNDLCARVERNFDDPLDAGRDLLRDHDIAPTREAMEPPMQLSDAIEKACQEAPNDVETRIRVVGKCPSSDNLGRLSVFRIGGSGLSLIEFMRFQFRGASAASASSS